ASCGAASSGLIESVRAAARNTSFHMPPAFHRTAAAAVRLCNELFLALHLTVGVVDVAPQLVALFRRELARTLGALLAARALAVRIANVVAHALALVVAHLALRILVVPSALTLLGER